MTQHTVSVHLRDLPLSIAPSLWDTPSPFPLNTYPEEQ